MNSCSPNCSGPAFNSAWSKLECDELPLSYANKLLYMFEQEIKKLHHEVPVLLATDPVIKEELSKMISEIECHTGSPSDQIKLSKQEHLILIESLLHDVSLASHLPYYDDYSDEYDSDDTATLMGTIGVECSPITLHSGELNDELLEKPSMLEKPVSVPAAPAFELRQSLNYLERFNTNLSAQFDKCSSTLNQIHLNNIAVFEALHALANNTSHMMDRVGTVRENMLSVRVQLKNSTPCQSVGQFQTMVSHGQFVGMVPRPLRLIQKSNGLIGGLERQKDKEEGNKMHEHVQSGSAWDTPDLEERPVDSTTIFIFSIALLVFALAYSSLEDS